MEPRPLPGSPTAVPYNLPFFPSCLLPRSAEKGPSPSPSVALSETKFTSNRTDLIDVTQDPDLRPAQACLLSWICRVYRPFASCLGPLAAGCHSFQPPYAQTHTFSLHLHLPPSPLTPPSFSERVCIYSYVCVRVCVSGCPSPWFGGATLHFNTRFTLFLRRPGRSSLVFLLPHVRTRAAGLFLVAGPAERRSWAVGTNLVSGSSRPRVKTLTHRHMCVCV